MVRVQAAMQRSAKGHNNRAVRRNAAQNTQMRQGNNRDNSPLNLKRKKKNTEKHGRLVHLLYFCKLK